MDRPLHVDMTTIASTRYHDRACTKWNKRRPRRRHAQRPPGEDVLNGGFGLFSLLIDCSNVFSIQIHFLPKKKKKKNEIRSKQKNITKDSPCLSWPDLATHHCKGESGACGDTEAVEVALAATVTAIEAVAVKMKMMIHLPHNFPSTNDCLLKRNQS